jgi:peptide deformylase
MLLNLCEFPDPILRKKSLDVDYKDKDLKVLAENMKDFLYKTSSGIGLSAVQVGILKRVIVIDIDRKNEKNDETKSIENPLFFVNPVIVWKSDKSELMNEGCLSVPFERSNVNRYLEIEVEYQDLELEKHRLKADGMLAHCLQHEIDHTNGILFIDHLSKLKRDLIIERVKKRNKTK